MATRPFLLAGCLLPASRSIIGRLFFAHAATAKGSSAGCVGSWPVASIGLRLGVSKAKESFAASAPIALRIFGVPASAPIALHIFGVPASTAICLGTRLP